MADEFKEQRGYRALAQHVLVVMHTRIEGTWCAYCDAVPGMNHRQEMAAVLECGCKVSEELARLLWPHMKGVPYAH